MTSSNVRVFCKVKKIGQGTYGKVYLVRSARGELLIQKEVPMHGLPASEMEATLNEVKILKKLQHPHIIAFRDAFVNKSHTLMIIMDYARGGDMDSLIKYHRHANTQLPEPELVKYSWQISSALAYCHSLKLLHRDLKPANIFLDEHSNAKLGDFGVSKTLPFTLAKAMTQCGTPLYMSPEMCAGRAYTGASDMWALGCVLYELATLSPPWVRQWDPRGPAGGLQGLMLIITTRSIDLAPLRARYSNGERQT